MMSSESPHNLPPYLRFELLVKELLVRRDFELLMKDVAPNGERLRIDVVASSREQRWVIEIKFYRTARAQASLLQSAAATVVIAGRRLNAAGGMLVVSSVVPEATRRSIEQEFKISLVDRKQLLSWAAPHPALADALNAVLELAPEERIELTGSAVSTVTATATLADAPPVTPDREGTDLCNQLKQIPKGKAGWQKHEEHCQKILKYLFPDDLTGWRGQQHTDDGLNRFDLVCRIHPPREFWQFLIDHLGSRYVLFEFKNYEEKIKQGQILTTEKYLLEKALRRVAIVFSREGAGDGALRMAQGAMREHGKLILVLSDYDVCEMLDMKQNGADPTDLLFDRADDFLLSLPR
jgi:hypothetical protein